MGSHEELTACFKTLTDKVKDATNKLWRRIAGWTRDQMIDAGAITYFSIIKDLAHVAGVYDVSDWMMVDERAERFRPLFNDEYSRDALVGLCIGTHPSHRANEYTMMQHSNLPQRLYSLIPYSILAGRGLHVELWPDLSRSQPLAPESRPLQHDAGRDRSRRIQSPVTGNAAPGSRAAISGISARPGSNIMRARRKPTSSTVSNRPDRACSKAKARA